MIKYNRYANLFQENTQIQSKIKNYKKFNNHRRFDDKHIFDLQIDTEEILHHYVGFIQPVWTM